MHVYYHYIDKKLKVGQRRLCSVLIQNVQVATSTVITKGATSIKMAPRYLFKSGQLKNKWTQYIVVQSWRGHLLV